MASRVSQVVAEVLYEANSQARLSQAVAEVLYVVETHALVTQVVAEALVGTASLTGGGQRVQAQVIG